MVAGRVWTLSYSPDLVPDFHFVKFGMAVHLLVKFSK
jgi:hypothetical protein